MAVPVNTIPTCGAGTPHALFEGPYTQGSPGAHSYDVSPDGQRFVMIKASEEELEAQSIHIVLNWFEELKRKAPVH